MRISSTFTRGAGLTGALLLAGGGLGAHPAAGLAAEDAGSRGASGTGTGTGAHAGTATGAGAHAGTGERTRLNLKLAQPIHHASASAGSGIIRTIVALVIVVGLIYVVARILRAIKGRDQRASGDGLTQLATLPLAPGRSLALVRSGQDIVLVGVAESGVTPIKTYTEQEAIESGIIAPEVASERSETSAPSFQGFLDSLRRITVRT